MRLAITNDKRQKGANNLDDPVPALELVEFDAVFDREFHSDVHFVAYGLREPGQTTVSEDSFPRLNKAVLGQVQEAGGDIVTQALVMDFDLGDQEGTEDLPLDDGGKPCWTKDMLALFFGSLREIDADLAKAGIASPIVYTTTHGARFVHRLTEPVPCEDAEDLMRGLIKVYSELGLEMDSACTDWTRLFRAPKVMRNGKPTWKERWYQTRYSTDRTDPAAIDPVAKSQVARDRIAGRIEPIRTGQPTSEDCHRRLFVLGTDGKERMTEMQKAAKRILKGTEAFAPIFEHKDVAQEGERHKTLIRMVGQATSFLLGPQAESHPGGFAPEDIFALFLAPVEDIDDDPQAVVDLWRMVRSCYEKDAARRVVAEQQKEELRERAAREERSLLHIVREFCDLPELHSDDEFVSHSALRRLMLVKEPSGKFRALCTKGAQRGSYSRIAVPQSSLHHLMENIANLDEHIPRWAPDSSGEDRLLSEAALGRMATDVVRVTGGTGYQYSHISGDAWDDLSLNLMLYRRNPNLDAQYSREVNEWLEMLTDEPGLLKHWLSRALEFEGGAICALSLAGESGAGKGLLAQGLVETLERPLRADKTALVSQFNSSLRHTPFLIVDEGLPKGHHDIADRFRTLVAGDPYPTEAKFQTPIMIRNPMRVLFTANNLDIVTQLASERQNRAEDQAALAIRLLHLDVPETPAVFLRSMGGLAYTKGWVQGATGFPSEFTLAKHLLWLYENREDYGQRGERFLVEGRAQNRAVQELRTSGTIPEAIAVALVTSLDNPSPAIKSGLAIQDGRLFATARAVLDQHRMLREQRETNVLLTTSKISRTMSNLASPDQKESVRMNVQALDGEVHRERWWDIDVRLLYTYAESGGFKRDVLRKLVTEQYGPNEDL